MLAKKSCRISSKWLRALIGSIESPKFPHKYTLSQIYKICHYFNITIEQLFISEEDFSKDRDIIDLLIFNIIRYGE